MIGGLHLMKYVHSSNLPILHPLTLTILTSSNLGISYFTALWISDVSSPCIPQSYYIRICWMFCVWGPVWAGVLVGFANSGPRLSACCRAVLWGHWLGCRAALCCACASDRVNSMCCRTFVSRSKLHVKVTQRISKHGWAFGPGRITELGATTSLREERDSRTNFEKTRIQEGREMKRQTYGSQGPGTLHAIK